MVKFGNWIFHYRNFLFPVFYLLLFIPSQKIFHSSFIALFTGALIAFTGEGIRALVMGFVNIQHGGRERTIYSSALITRGIFSHCRNPLYIGNILILLGLGVAANSLLFVLILLPLFIFFYQAIVLAEENFLLQNFGPAYSAYRLKVNRWLPDFKGISGTFSTMRFSFRRVLIKEYNSTCLWLTGLVLLIMKTYWQESREDFYLRLPLFIAALILILICYLLIRYMKKSHKWSAE
jgi:protein-S-isoprenylcysteine O-methyltransferase Ste14